MSITKDGKEYPLSYFEELVRDAMQRGDYKGLNSIAYNGDVESTVKKDNCTAKIHWFVNPDGKEVFEFWLRFLVENGSAWARDRLYDFYKYELDDYDMAAWSHELYIEWKRARGEDVTAEDYYNAGVAAYNQIGCEEQYKGFDTYRVKAGKWFEMAVKTGFDINNIEDGEGSIKHMHEWDDMISEKTKSSKDISSSGSGGCYIATAVYGSYDCPEVWTLRRYRDFKLLQTGLGRLFVKCYYATSPAVVKCFGKAEWFNRFWKSILDRFITKLRKDGYDSSQYYDRSSVTGDNS